MIHLPQATRKQTIPGIYETADRRSDSLWAWVTPEALCEVTVQAMAPGEQMGAQSLTQPAAQYQALSYALGHSRAAY